MCQSLLAHIYQWAGKGCISLLNKYHIKNVSHVLDLSFNLFASKITKELNRELILTTNHCVLQDLLKGRRIGIGLVFKGLYKLPIKVVVALVSAIKENK